MHGDGGSENAYEQEFVCQNDRVVGSNTFSPFFRGQYEWAPEILAAAQSVRRLVARFHAARAGRAQPFPLHPIGERSPGSAPAPQFSDRLRTRSCGRRCGTSKRFFGTDNKTLARKESSRIKAGQNWRIVRSILSRCQRQRIERTQRQ